MKKNFLIVTGVVLVLIAGFLILRNSDPTDPVSQVSETPTEEPLEVALKFFNQWIGNNDDAAEPLSQSDLLMSATLDESVKTKITTALAASAAGGVDPVTCQTAVPPRMVGKVLYAEPLQAQLMMLARGTDERSAFQSIVTLKAVAGKWQITDITCAQGETAPERDFDFESEGFLLKNVPPPLDPNTWYLVYEQNGVMGHTLPLTLDANSLCIEASGTETVCDESRFRDATKVFLRADMTEAGAIVRRLEF